MRLLPVLLALLALAAAAPAHAADGTYVPARLKGDLVLRYGGGLDWENYDDRLGPGGSYQSVASALVQEHGLLVEGSFSPWYGLGVLVELPFTFFRQRTWTDATDFRVDPDTGAATLVGGPALAADVLEGAASARRYGGIGDLRLGVRFLPFSQDGGLPKRTLPATLALDLGLRVPSGGNHDAVRDDGSAGPGVGGPTLELGLTAARRVGNAEPYVGVEAALTAPYRAPFVDAAGTPLVDEDGETGILADPADRVTLRFGGNFSLKEDPSAQTAAYLDLGFGLSYVGPQEVSSGRFVPAPLPETAGRLAVRGEHLLADVGLGFRLRPGPEVEILIDVDGLWRSPHAVEMVDKSNYGVLRAPDSFAMRWSAGVRLRFR